MLTFESQLRITSERLSGALSRIEELSGQQPRTEGSSQIHREALLFNLERAAWALLEMASSWVFEFRLGIPRKETESLDLLQREGWLELDTARKLKQLAEFRNLSSREEARIDWSYLGGDLSSEISLMRQWNERALKFGRHDS
jgi:uncharacterized protein YutE (UPF0331/DUF86 family)